MSENIKLYLKTIEQSFKTGQATEHSYRAALETLFQTQLPGITTINEPKRIACGAPDLTILKNDFPLGYIEAKDIGHSLDEAERTDQLRRYLSSLENLILTNYVEFRWYVKGEHRHTVKFGTVNLAARKINPTSNLSEAETLLTEFLAQGPEKLASSQEVARRMAKLTHMIRTIVVRAFDQNQASYLLRDLRQALAQTLLPGLDRPERVGEFADIYAQTITYGLFAARCNHKGNSPFRLTEATAEIPKTNPFLRRLFAAITGPDFNEEPYAGFVKDLVQLLANADMEAILADFGHRTGHEDPVVHFYETFLATYDPRLRELRGVYYTPEPVVSYIVRSVDSLLKEHFNLPNGLSDATTITHKGRHLPRVLLLDPAVGTGTFLYKVIDHIRNKFRTKGNAGMWSGYVRGHLLQKLFGFELLMVPYAVAHFKLALQLAGQDLGQAERSNWAYDFDGDERLKIYLTNTLEEVEREVHTLFGLMRVITEEARAAAEVKQDLPILVVLGNPPYSGHSANRSWKVNNEGKRIATFIGRLVQDYYFVDGEPLRERNTKWLQDDYVKFIRWGQWRIEQTGVGILAFITNHGYLDNPTFRGMRQNLMNTFTDIYLINLHGNSNKKETTPDGHRDQNVFDIQQGVAIGIFIKAPGKSGPAQIHHTDFWGDREVKYELLSNLDVKSTEWQKIEPQSPLYLFMPQDVNLLDEYQEGWKLTDIITLNGIGMNSHRDAFAIGFERTTVERRVSDLVSDQLTDEALRSSYNLRDTQDFNLAEARATLRQLESRSSIVVSCIYRPFDYRFVIYHPSILDRPRTELNFHIVNRNNLSLVTTRQTREPFSALAVDRVCGQHKIVAQYDGSSVFPLYLYPNPAQLFSMSPWPEGREGRTPNLNPKFVTDIEENLELSFNSEGAGDLQTTFGPEDIFNYIYAILYSPTYRGRYAEFLKSDFPYIPYNYPQKLDHELSKN